MKLYFKGEHFVSPEFLRPSAIVGACPVLLINECIKQQARDPLGSRAFGICSAKPGYRQMLLCNSFYKMHPCRVRLVVAHKGEVIYKDFNPRTHVECDPSIPAGML